MKKKFLLAVLAFTMPMAGCSFQDLMFWKTKENDPTTEQKDQVVDPEAGVKTEKLNTIIYDLVKDSFDESAANYAKDKSAIYAGKAVERGVDPTKIEKYVNYLSKAEDLLEVGEYFISIKAEDGVDDAVNFCVALGKSMLLASSKYSVEQKALYEGLIATIELDEVNLVNNTVGFLNGTIDAFDGFTSASFLDSATNIFDEEKGKISTLNLKKVLTKGGDIVTEFVKVKDNAKYLAGFAQKLSKVAVELTDTPEAAATNAGAMYLVLKVLNLVDIPSAVGKVFDALGNIATKAKTMNDAYYTYIDSLNDPAEGICYAALAVLEEVYNEFTITDNEVREGTDKLIKFIRDAYAIVKDYIGAPEFVDKIVSSENTKEILGNLLVLFADLVNSKSSALSAKNLAKIAALFISATVSSNGRYGVFSDELLMNVYPSYIQSAINLDDLQNAIDGGYSYYVDAVTEVVVDKNGTYSASEGSFYYYDGIYECYWSDTSCRNLEPYVRVIYELFDEISTSENTGIIVQDILNIFGSSVNFVKEFKDDFGIEQDVIDLLDMINGVLESDSEIVKDLVTDLFKTLKNLIGAFLPNGSEPADIDVTKMYVEMNIGTFSFPLNSLKEERLNGLDDFVGDVYELLEDLGFIEPVKEFLNNFIEGIADTKTKEEFVEMICFIANAMLVIQEN